MNWIARYFMTVGAALSQLLSAILFSMNPHQDLSRRCAENRSCYLWGVFEKLINMGAYIIAKQEDHCQDSLLSDIKRAEALLAKYPHLRGNKDE